MNNEQFDELVKMATAARLKMAAEKGREYANEQEDRLYNLKVLGTQLGLEPEAVLMVYLMKHILSINTYVKDLQRPRCNEGRPLTEPILGRLDDAQCYLDLLRGLISERITSAYAETDSKSASLLQHPDPRMHRESYENQACNCDGCRAERAR